MNIALIISSIIAISEYILAIYVYKNGKVLPKLFATTLFFLASYQLGEVIAYTFDDYSRAGVQFAYFSTTLLPPLGILMIQSVAKKSYGYTLFQTLAIGFALMYAFEPYIIERFSVDLLFIRINETKPIFTYWAYYYLIALTYAMLIGGFEALTNKNKEVKKFMIALVGAYTSFYIVSVAFALAFPSYRSAFASLMCALAFTAALIMSKVSLSFNPQKLGIDSTPVIKLFTYFTK